MHDEAFSNAEHWVRVAARKLALARHGLAHDSEERLTRLSEADRIALQRAYERELSGAVDQLCNAALADVFRCSMCQPAKSTKPEDHSEHNRWYQRGWDSIATGEACSVGATQAQVAAWRMGAEGAKRKASAELRAMIPAIIFRRRTYAECEASLHRLVEYEDMAIMRTEAAENFGSVENLLLVVASECLNWVVIAVEDEPLTSTDNSLAEHRWFRLWRERGASK